MVYGEITPRRDISPLMLQGIKIQIQIYDVNKKNYRSIPVVVDTGATESLIPPQRLLDLGYDLTNAPRSTSQTANGLVDVLSITVTKIIAIKQSVEPITVTCLEPNANIPEPLERIGLLGLSFLSKFDNLNISFLRRQITLT